MVKIVLDAGHGYNTPGKRCDIRVDSNQTREWWLNQRIVSKVMDKLKDYSDVAVLRVDDPTGKEDVPRNKRCKAANDFGADIYCSFHHNAGLNGRNGGGIVVFTYDDSPEAVELRDILYDSLISAGGLKGNRSTPKTSNPGLEVLNSTKMIATLVEHGFMDSKDDTPVILTEEYADKMADGWINFFEKYLDIEKKSDEAEMAGVDPVLVEDGNFPPETDNNFLVKVTANSLYIRENPGISSRTCGIIRDNGVYTIVEVRKVGEYEWGKLKSGAGWISLKYTEKVKRG